MNYANLTRKERARLRRRTATRILGSHDRWTQEANYLELIEQVKSGHVDFVGKNIMFRNEIVIPPNVTGQILNCRFTQHPKGDL